ncbi:MAG TPA: type II toxin-antitoxin system HicB family antitoxin [Thermoanaerobaculia bacterium]|nr:type II toxin-antitoxin system HicB family antitoxin [Thermoanaerobaculia bacterium]
MSAKDLSYYMGLRYPVEVREGGDGGYFVTNPDLDGCMAEGASLEEAIANLADSRELWVETRLENGYPVPEPPDEEYSGRVSLRMAPSLHAQLVRIAERSGISLNLLLNSILATYAGGAEPLMEILQNVKGAMAQLSAMQATAQPADGPPKPSTWGANRRSA